MPVIERPAEKPAQRVEQPAAFTATVVEPAIVEPETKTAKKKKRPGVISEVRVEPIETMQVPAQAPIETKIAPPIWRQPIPLAIGGSVLAAVLGLTIYMISRPSSLPTGATASQPAATEPSTVKNNPTITTPQVRQPETPSQPMNQEQSKPSQSQPQTPPQQQQKPQAMPIQPPPSQPQQNVVTQPPVQQSATQPTTSPTPAPQQQAQSTPPPVTAPAVPTPQQPQQVAVVTPSQPPVTRPAPSPAAVVEPPAPKPEADVQILGGHQTPGNLLDQKIPQPSAYLDPPFTAISKSVPQDLAARAKGSSVTLRLTVDENGRVLSAVFQSGDQSLASAVISAATSGWQFSPPKIKGKSYKAIVVVTAKF